MTGSLTSDFRWSRWRENVPGIPGARATRKFAYLVRGPFNFKYGSLDAMILVVSTVNYSSRLFNYPGKSEWQRWKPSNVWEFLVEFICKIIDKNTEYIAKFGGNFIKATYSAFNICINGLCFIVFFSILCADLLHPYPSGLFHCLAEMLQLVNCK